jgi:AcrR family transcriptional regulator
MADDVLVPPYRRIADAVRERIARGELRVGDRVPSARQITRDWDVAIATATKALAVLRDEGLTVPRPGVGTVVAAAKTAPLRKREGELSRESIVRAAIAVADAHGMAELSMRRIATELGVATMSLYRHVPSKDDLIVAMIDAVYGEVRLPAAGRAGWRAELELCTRVQWAMFRRHPWLAPSMSLTRPQLAPNAMVLTERVLDAFDGTRLSLSDRVFVHVLLFSFVRGVATALEPEADAIRDTGMTNDQWLDTQNEALAEVIDTHQLAHFAQFADIDLDLDQLFRFGLDRLMDGMERFVGRRESTTAGIPVSESK